MNIWLSNIDANREKRANAQKMICVTFEKEVHNDVRQNCKKFFRYLRKKYCFPSKVCVYIETSEHQLTDENKVSAFFPSCTQSYPSVHISTGYYETFIRKYGKDDAIASILWSIAYEITHYYLWIANLDQSSHNSEIRVTKCADKIIHRYYMEAVIETKHIWRCDKWKKYRKEFSPQTGLRVSYDKNVDPNLKNACVTFFNWLRFEYDFPIRINVHIESLRRIKAQDGSKVCGTFFRPDNRNQKPYSYIATGDYYDLIQKMDKDSAILSILWIIAHELTHYFQWINKLNLTLKGEERQATIYAYKIIDSYMITYFGEE